MTLRDRAVSLVPGALLGAVAWLAGYLVTYLHAAASIRDSPVRRVIEFLGADAPVWKVVGLVFYNEHFVDVVVEGPFGGTGSFVGGEGGFTDLLFLVPVVTIGLAGVVVARTAADPLSGAGAGLTVVAGYLPLSIAGAFLFSVDSTPPIHPDLVTAVLLAGVVYPAVLGVAGGLLGPVVRRLSEIGSAP